jgi:alkylated DNA repair dioxygenase AlkB
MKEAVERKAGCVFDQCIVNEYLPGQGISRHIDKTSLFGPTIACVSIGSDATIRFTKDKNAVDVLVPRRSLYIMQGDARYAWTHEMPARLYDAMRKRGTRYSITFRKMIGR